MAECRNCGQQIEFKPHPKNPSRMAPFDADGEIHFARCKKPKEKVTFKSVSDWKCGSGHPGRYFYIGVGGRLAGWCGEDCHTSWVPDTPGNRLLVNIAHNPKRARYGEIESHSFDERLFDNKPVELNS